MSQWYRSCLGVRQKGVLGKKGLNKRQVDVATGFGGSPRKANLPTLLDVVEHGGDLLDEALGISLDKGLEMDGDAADLRIPCVLPTGTREYLRQYTVPVATVFGDILTRSGGAEHGDGAISLRARLEDLVYGDGANCNCPFQRLLVS